MQSICIVEDDDSIRGMLAYALKSVGFKIREYTDGTSFINDIFNNIPSLILLDIMLSGKDGMNILTTLKKNEKTKNIPIIMLTAKSTEFDKIKGLDAGADDYVTKPFSVMEVISRVKAVLRRSSSNEVDKKEEIKIGNIFLSNIKRSVTVNKEEIILTYKEFELLQMLLINNGIVLSRDKILDEIWGIDYYGETRTVDMHIKSLRAKLGNAGKIIKTIRNIGYKCEEQSELI